MITYTALSPSNTVVTIRVRSLSRALELARFDLARDWVPARIVYGRWRFDVEHIAAAVRELAPAVA